MSFFSPSFQNGCLDNRTQEPVVKQEPIWNQTPTTPIAELGQLGLGDPFAAHFLHQQQHRIKSDPGDFDLDQKAALDSVSQSTSQPRNTKRRPGPYDNLKDPSGKINLELVSGTLLLGVYIANILIIYRNKKY